MKVFRLFVEGNREEAVTEFLPLYERAARVREEQPYEGRKHIFWSLGFYCQFGDTRLQELVLREWATHTEDERHWQFQEVPIFMKMTIRALLLTDRFRETYASLKSFTSYLLKVTKTNL